MDTDMKQKIARCCHRIFTSSPSTHAVLCKKWILPLRIIAISSLFLHMVYLSMVPARFYSGFLVIFHIVIALILLNECRKSDIYHTVLKEFNQRTFSE